jgi:shikimate dehydrogenase
LNAVVVPMHVAREDVAQVLPALSKLRNLAGLIVTVPHKQAVARMGVALSPMAQRCGAANVLRRTGEAGWEADLYDGLGFVAGLLREGFDPAGTAVSLIGAGGAGSAIAFALAAHGAGRIRIFDLEAAKAADLAARLRQSGADARFWDGEGTDGDDLLVNATPAGMRSDDPLPVPAEALRAGLRVAEVIMQPELTPLLVEAGRRGCGIHRGRHMMEGQLELMAGYFEAAVARLANRME